MKALKQRGLSLVELLVALAIGGFLIIGAVTVQSQTRKTFSVTEQQARLQETARYALSVIEPEVQQAGRSANLSVQALNLASDLANRIRSNREGLGN